MRRLDLLHSFRPLHGHGRRGRRGTGSRRSAVVRLAPDFSIPGNGGKPRTLRSLRGQSVVLLIAKSARTGALKKQVKYLQELFEQFAGKETMFAVALREGDALDPDKHPHRHRQRWPGRRGRLWGKEKFRHRDHRPRRKYRLPDRQGRAAGAGARRRAKLVPVPGIAPKKTMKNCGLRIEASYGAGPWPTAIAHAHSPLPLSQRTTAARELAIRNPKFRCGSQSSPTPTIDCLPRS
jgi:hypothetical protein